jgi:acetyltransferase-like isoleucine patch superfamily enzyme
MVTRDVPARRLVAGNSANAARVIRENVSRERSSNDAVG